MTGRAISRLAPLLAALAAFAGCAPADSPLPPESRPLADFDPFARRYATTRTLDFGAPATRARLWSGWGADEVSADESHVWGIGERSTLTLDVVEPRRLRLVLRGWAFPFSDSRPQEVTVSVNGAEIGRRVVSPRPSQIELDVDADQWRAGENLLELAYARHAPGEGDAARAVAWDRLRLSGVDEPTAAAEFEVGGALGLPAGTAFEVTLDLPGGSWLSWSALSGPASARLEVAVAAEAESESTRGFSPGDRGRFRLAADGDGHRPRRIALRAVGEGELRRAGARLHVGEGLAPQPPSQPIAPTRAGEPVTAASRPNLLIYVVDTLRADHLGCYGYSRPTSPELDRFARGAALFREARAQSSWTRPAMATILTGLLPATHQAEDVRDRLPERIDTLAERLARHGYLTAMFTANGNAAGQFGFRQGFDDFAHLAERKRTRGIHAQSQEVNRVVFDWLAKRDASRPFFLVVHTTDPHDPYTPRSPYRERFAAGVEDGSIGNLAALRRLGELPAAEVPTRAAALRALYDGEVASNDAAFGALLARLKALGLEEETVVVFTSDHGEEFFEHGGWLHGRTLYEEQLRIPLVVRVPGAPPRVLPGPAEQIDVAPTLLELAGAPVAAELPGRSLVAEIVGGVPPAARTAFATLDRRGERAATAMRAQWKLLFHEQVGKALLRPPFELFALSSDPGEQRDLVVERPLRRRWLEGELAALERRHRSALPRTGAEIDRELEERLRALGYLN